MDDGRQISLGFTEFGSIEAGMTFTILSFCLFVLFVSLHTTTGFVSRTIHLLGFHAAVLQAHAEQEADDQRHRVGGSGILQFAPVDQGQQSGRVWIGALLFGRFRGPRTVDSPRIEARRR